MSAIPSQSTVRPHTNTHGYVNVSPDFSETSDLEKEEKDSTIPRSTSKSPVPHSQRDLKPIQPKDSSDDFELYGWKAEDVTPMSSQPSSLAANSDGGTLTSPPHEEETIDKPDSDGERNEDGDNIGVLTLPGDPLLSDFSETSDLEEEEKDVDSDGMIKSHVKFDQIFDVNLSWDDL